MYYDAERKCIICMRKGIKVFSIILLFFTISVLFSSCGEKKLSDTVKWINATYAIITEANEGELTAFGGFKKNAIYEEVEQKLLESSWEITDKESAKENVDWLLKEGHNSQFLQLIKEQELDTFTREEFEDAVKTIESEEAKKYYTLLFDTYEKYGENGILAWDLCRATQLYGAFYVADYYTYEEALNGCLEVAKMLQEHFSSWEDMADSYLRGYQFFSESYIEEEGSDAYKRNQVYEKLKAMENSPYQINWNTELKKEW